MSDFSLPLGQYEVIRPLAVNRDTATLLCRDTFTNTQVICKTLAQMHASDSTIAALTREFFLTEKAVDRQLKTATSAN